MTERLSKEFNALFAEEARRIRLGSSAEQTGDLRRFQMSGDGLGGRFQDSTLIRPIGKGNAEIAAVRR